MINKDMASSPESKKFSINKEDSPEGKMRTLYTTSDQPLVSAYFIAAKELEQVYPGQTHVEEAINLTEDGKRIHPQTNALEVLPNQTVLLIETTYELTQPLTERAEAIREDMYTAAKQPAIVNNLSLQDRAAD